jgi:galactonate dehydratase
MKITEIETFTVGAGWKNWLFVKVHTDAGIYGIGEGTLNGFIATTEAGVHELKHLAIGQDPRRISALWKRLLDSVSLDGGHIHRTVIAAIEVACWDILGKSLGVPIHQLLGGRVRDSVLGYANGWYRTERTPEPSSKRPGRDREGLQGVQARSLRHRAGLHLARGARSQLRHLPHAARQAAEGHPHPDRCPRPLHRDRRAAGGRKIRRLDIYWWEEPTSRDRQETVHEVAHRSPIPVATGEMYDTVGQFYSAGGRRRRQHLPARADVAGRHRAVDAGRPSGPRPRQPYRPAPERRPGRHRRLPATRRLPSRTS